MIFPGKLLEGLGESLFEEVDAETARF